MIEAIFLSKVSSGHVESETDTHAKSLCQNCQEFTQKFSFPLKAPLQALIVLVTALSYNFSPKTEKLYTRSPKTYKKLNMYTSNFNLVKRKSILKILSKNTSNSFILFRSKPEFIQQILVLLP